MNLARLIKVLLFLLGILFKGEFYAASKPLQVKAIFRDSALAGVRVTSTCLPDTWFITDKRGIAYLPLHNIDTCSIHLKKNGYLGIDTLINGPFMNQLVIEILPVSSKFSKVVVSASLQRQSSLESPIPVDVFYPAYFNKNPVSNLFESLSQVNGLRPQINCNVCNTGDIHINGLEGPYTMVLIDGMPIVSSLSTVYGLFGIPNSMIERMEVVKGPASTLFGSEALGGVVNVITKNAGRSEGLNVHMMGTSWSEWQTDIAFSGGKSKKVNTLTGISHFLYNSPRDMNDDGFTDLTLQHRISIFEKLKIHRKNTGNFNLAARYFYEDRWGGQTHWTTEFRGGDSIYAESIYTSRLELMGNYEFKKLKNSELMFSFNRHKQNSFYGTTPFHAIQNIGFIQNVTHFDFKKHKLITGLALRATHYMDNTPATSDSSGYNPINLLPGIFIQDEYKQGPRKTFLAGLRIDYHSQHGPILTPRLAYLYNLSINQVLRISAGTGFRVVNIFTEDHAALTGARKVVLEDKLKPETSANLTINHVYSKTVGRTGLFNWEMTAFYTHFRNRILPDYDTDPNTIFYNNLDGYALSAGIGSSVRLVLSNGFSADLGCTFLNVKNVANGIEQRPVLTEKFNSSWTVSIPMKILKTKMSLDYTGNLYSPMRLPVLGPDDPRPENSPWWSIQNVKFNIPYKKNWKFYFGVKNLLNFTPYRNLPFLIARSNDPFDKQVKTDTNGQVIKNDENPHGLTFDPSYTYAPNQGIRFFIGFNYKLR